MGSMTVPRSKTATCLTAVLLSLLLLLDGLENRSNGFLVVKAFNLPLLRQHNLYGDFRIIQSTPVASQYSLHRILRHDDNQSATTTTALFMGLRDFIKGRLRKMGDEQQDNNRKLKLPPPVRADDDDDDDDEDDIYDFLDGGDDVEDDDVDDDIFSSSATRSVLEDYTFEQGNDEEDDGSSNFQAQTPPPLRMGEDPDSKEINVFSLDEKESIQERINRVKSGKMSEEEKQAFLRTSLSGATSAESRRLPLRPPSADTYYTAASPFPGDPILRSIAGQKSNADEQSSSASPAFGQSAADFILDKQKKKRDYLDMVTNPNRFDIYRTAATARLGGGSDGRTVSVAQAEAKATAGRLPRNWASLKEYSPTSDSSVLPTGQAAPNESASKDQSIDVEEEKEEEEALSLSNTTASNAEAKSSNPPLPADLGARLGAAALAYEESRLKGRSAAGEASSSSASATNNNKKPEKELTTFEKAALQKSEQQRMQKQMQVQDDYWTKRLAAERAAREKAEAEGLDQQIQSSKNPAWQRLKQNQGGSAKYQGWGGSAASQKGRAFNPDERELLSQAEHDRNEAWEHNQALINQSAARKDGSVPMDTVTSSLNDVQTEQQFINEQARRRANTDKIRNEQLERLRSLSSPLPSPAPRTIPSSRGGVVPAPSPQYRPRQSSSQANGPTVDTRRSRSAKYKVDQSVDYLKNNMNDVRRQQEASKIASGPQPSLNDVVRNRDEKPSYQQMLSSLNDVQNRGGSRTTPAAGGATTGIKPLGYTKPSTGVQPMGYTKKDPPAVVPSESLSSSPSSKSAVQSDQPSAKQQQQAPKPPLPIETSRPAIRMKLPLQDVEDEDDEEEVGEEGIDARSNTKMSIAEAMKRTTGGDGKSVDQDERSRKWGVDMSKFT